MKKCLGILLTCSILLILTGCQAPINIDGIAEPTAITYKVWYNQTDTLSGLMPWDDKGILVLNEKEIQFVGRKQHLKMDKIQGISYDRLSKTIMCLLVPIF